jgi:hypothetical protein
MHRMNQSELSSTNRKSLVKSTKSTISTQQHDRVMARMEHRLSQLSRGSSRKLNRVRPSIASLLQDEVEGYDFKTLKEYIEDHKKAIDKINFAPAQIVGGRRVEEAVHGLNLTGCIDSAVHLCGPTFSTIFHEDLDIENFVVTYVRHLSQETEELKTISTAIAGEFKQPDKDLVRIELIGDHMDKLQAMEDEMKARFEQRTALEEKDRAAEEIERLRLLAEAGQKASEEDLTATIPIHKPRFADSPEKAELRRMLANADEDFEREVMKEFGRRCKLYTGQTNDSTARKERQNELLNRQSKSKLIQQLSNGYRDHMIAIAIHVRNAVQNYPEMMQKLRLQVIIKESGRVVTSPLSPQSPDIRAMYQILCDEYRKPNLVTTLHMMTNMFTRKPPAGGVVAAMAQVNDDLNVWKQMDLSKHNTEDTLFTMLLLKDLPADSDPRLDVRTDATRRVLEYARTVEASDTRPSEDMPLYQHLTDWIKDVYLQAKISSTNRATGGDKSQRSTNKDSTRSQYESAAAAESMPYQGKTGTDSVPRASSRSSDLPRKFIAADTVFNREVLRSENWFMKVYSQRQKKEQEWPYTATIVDCVTCLVEKANNNGKTTTHNPSCYTTEVCFKCTMYGHKPGQCRQQTPHTTMKKPSTTASKKATANSAAEEVLENSR